MRQSGKRRADGGKWSVMVGDAASADIHSFTYDDVWYTQTDGQAYSLVARDPAGDVADWNLAGGWRPSEALQGLPAADDTDVTPPAFQSAAFDPATRAVAFTFSESIGVALEPGMGAFDLVLGDPVELTTLAVDAKVVTLTLPPELANGLYRVTLPGSSIGDYSDHTLAAPASFAFLYVAGGQTLVVPPSNTTYEINQLEIGAGAKLDLKE